MADFVDPLTLASSRTSDDEGDSNGELESERPTETAEQKEAEDGDGSEEEEDIFDAEGKSEEGVEAEPEKMTVDTPVKSAEDYIFDDEQDLFISVDKPEKHISSMETFISYQVVTKTSRSSFDDSEYAVRRRYQDFVWLREKLQDSHPTHLIPPLPAKFVVKGMVDRFSQNFVGSWYAGTPGIPISYVYQYAADYSDCEWRNSGTRSRALDSFLKRIAEHPVISFNEHLKVFLTSKEFTSHRKQSQSGLLSRVGGAAKAATSVGSSIRSRPREPPFAEMSEHVATFREKMAVTDRVAERLLNEERELVNDLKEYSPTYLQWATSEESEAISTVMTGVSKAIESCSEAAEKNAENHQLYFIPPLKEYILYSDCIEQVLRRRDAMQQQRDKCSEELKRKKEEIENLPKSDQSYSFSAMLGRNPEEVRRLKEEKMNEQIEEITQRFEGLSDNLEKANGDLKSDMERWKFNKKQDMKQVFMQLADSQISYFSQCLSAWESVIPLVQEGPDLEEGGEEEEEQAGASASTKS